MFFVSLLSPKGKGREAMGYLKKLKAPKGITIHGAYMTFGRYDGVVAFEAPDLKKAMDFVLTVGIETGYLVETLSAVEVKEM